MKRMVLIPEEKLLRYEERDKAKNVPEGIMRGGGENLEESQDSTNRYPLSRF